MGNNKRILEEKIADLKTFIDDKETRALWDNDTLHEIYREMLDLQNNYKALTGRFYFPK